MNVKDLKEVIKDLSDDVEIMVYYQYDAHIAYSAAYNEEDTEDNVLMIVAGD